LGGAGLGTLVSVADEQAEFRRMLMGQVDYERERLSKLVDENERLKAQVEQLKLELKVERQSKFATSADNKSEARQTAGRDDDGPKKRPTGSRQGAYTPEADSQTFRPMAGVS
jgi:hypothetical protein